MAILTIEQITNADDLPTKVLDVPEWGGEVKIRQLTVQQKADVRVQAVVNDQVDDTKLELGLLVEAVVEPNLSYEHLGILRGKNADVVDRILTEVFTLSALDEEAVARQRREFPGEAGELDGVPSSSEAGDDPAQA